MPIPDEKSRSWTRPEDYWPPRRRRRSSPTSLGRFGPPAGEDAAEKRRPLLDVVPYVALLASLAVLAFAIIVIAWPGGTVRPAASEQAPPSAVGTAPKGWIDEQPARS